MSDDQVLIDWCRQFAKVNGNEKTVDHMCKVLESAGIVDPRTSVWRIPKDPRKSEEKYAVLFPVREDKVKLVAN